MKQHKWHKEIKAWADGAEIEYRNIGFEDWASLTNTKPSWEADEYRIKPTPKEPQYLKIEITEKGFTFNCQPLFDAGVVGKFKIKLEVDV